jgi:hypothetical protein
MRKLPLLVFALIIFSSFSVSTNSNIDPVVEPVTKVAMPIDKIASMKMKEAEKILGRKFTLKEKIAFKIAQLKLKKGLKAKEEGKSSKGQTAMILGIIGIACVLIPYGIIAAIPLGILAIVFGAEAKKANKNDSKAKTGIILGIVTLGLVALALLLVLIVIATWSWGW